MLLRTNVRSLIQRLGIDDVHGELCQEMDNLLLAFKRYQGPYVSRGNTRCKDISFWRHTITSQETAGTTNLPRIIRAFGRFRNGGVRSGFRPAPILAERLEELHDLAEASQIQ